MPDQNIAVIYFSGTHVTKTYAQVIRDALSDLGCTVQLFDVTSYKSRQEQLLALECSDRLGHQAIRNKD